MSETARILTFRARRNSEPISEASARAVAEQYLETAPEARNQTALTVDVLFGLSLLLRERTDINPSSVLEEATSLHSYASKTDTRIGLFDETEYLQGEFALLAGKAARQLGDLTSSELWLDRADAAFRHTVNSAPLLTNVGYARLALRYSAHQYLAVNELIPSLIKSYEALGMAREALKSRFLQAMSLKQVGRLIESMAIFRVLARDPAASGEPSVLGQSLVELAEHAASQGDIQNAMALYRHALEVLTSADRPISVAHLKWSIGETLRLHGDLPQALELLRESQREFSTLKMANYIVLLHLAIAETLLAMSRPREADWEILAALPTIEEQKMVPEGFAAVALLKESVRRRRTDPNALRELRERLQANR